MERVVIGGGVPIQTTLLFRDGRKTALAESRWTWKRGVMPLYAHDCTVDVLRYEFRYGRMESFVVCSCTDYCRFSKAKTTGLGYAVDLDLEHHRNCS